MVSWIVLMMMVMVPFPQRTVARGTPDQAVIFECQPPEMEEGDDFFRVNPSLRQQYYAYLQQDRFKIPEVRPPDPNHEFDVEIMLKGRTPEEEFVLKGRFRLFVKDFFNNNARLVTLGRSIAQYLTAPPDQSASIPFKSRLKEIEKLSDRLSGKLSVLLPGKLDDFKAKKKRAAFYRAMGRKDLDESLMRLLLVKLNSFEQSICRLFFPDQFTVSVDELSGRSTPIDEAEELRLIAKVLAAKFPSRGLPKNFRYGTLPEY